MSKSAINQNFSVKPRKKADIETLKQGIDNGDRTLLAQAITLIESQNQEDYELAQKLITYCLPKSGNSIRIGVTGVPGAGKSTLIESLGEYITNKKNIRLAVLAVDPSSTQSKGSILADKTRMEELAKNNNVFIRPSPSSGSLGGVAQRTRESIIICEAAGYDTIFIETVGVGQSETQVASMVDVFLLLMLAGAGDELQGIKRGIMEMAKIIAINKADGDNIKSAEHAKRNYENALHLFQPGSDNWQCKVLTCSALEQTGIVELWSAIESYYQHCLENDYFSENRNQQNLFWFNESIKAKLENSFFTDTERKNMFEKLANQIAKNKITTVDAIDQLFKKS